MTHLTMDQLLACREPQSEPGTAAARAHLSACAVCTQELERLEQRVARLRALPPLQPARDQWPAVRARIVTSRRRRLVQRSAWGSLVAAAGIALVVLVKSGPLAVRVDAAPKQVASVDVEDLVMMKTRSQVLEAALESYNPQVRVLDGRTAVLADALQDRIATLDQQLQAAQLEGPDRGLPARDARLLQLWEERVGLLDALVDVRVTRASKIGL